MPKKTPDPIEILEIEGWAGRQGGSPRFAPAKGLFKLSRAPLGEVCSSPRLIPPPPEKGPVLFPLPRAPPSQRGGCAS